MKKNVYAALCGAFLFALAVAPARADESFAEVADQINTKVVKLFGAGGFKGLVSHGTGALVSADGYILTVASPLLQTNDLIVHLSDGRKYMARLVATEQELDLALVKIETKEKLGLPFFDVIAAAKQPLAKTGTGVLAFSNQFRIAERDEPVSIQRGVIASYGKLKGRRGIHEAAYGGNVYVLDAITNNPGAGGGVITTRKGQLLGIIGKELTNELSNTFINYALPIQAAEEVEETDGKKRWVSIVEIIEKKDKYKPTERKREKVKLANYHGIILVPNVVDLTPAYVEEVALGSPGHKAGLKPDDEIVYVDGELISSINTLNEIFGKIKPKTPVTLEVKRGEKLTTLKMEMGEPLPSQTPKTPVPEKESK